MSQKCSRCGEETRYSDNFHCRQILIGKLRKLGNKERNDLILHSQGDESWEHWKRDEFRQLYIEKDIEASRSALEEYERNAKKQKEKIIETLEPAQLLLDNNDFLKADQFVSELEKHSEQLIEEYEKIKSRYVKTFFKKTFKKIKELSNEQFLAIADTSKNLLLRARAGSGKTTTLSSKIAYLIKGENIDQNKIVALCFNTVATKNIIKKLVEDFDIKYREKENIATFHSLAFQISPPNEGVETLFDDHNLQGEQKLTAFVEKILEKKWNDPFTDLRSEGIQSNPNNIFGFIKKIWTNLKYAQFKTVVYAIAREDRRFDIDEEADRLKSNGIQFGSREHYLYRRMNLSYITLDGKHVKSSGEKCIADYLFEHDIKYKYEPNFRMGEHTYYPDFQLYENNVIIEHWGIDELDNKKRVPQEWLKTWHEYKNEMKEKRAYWKAYNKNSTTYRLLETNITQLRDGREAFEEILSEKLHDYGVHNNRLDIDTIIKEMSHNLRSEFSKKIVSYIQKAKQNELSPEKMKLKIFEAKYPKYSKVNVFLNLANIIYKQYEVDKGGEEKKKIDFYDFLSNAEKKIDTTKGECKLRSGVSINEIEWLLIDEFQDFSPLFLALIKVIQKYNSKVKLFCVGDNWQAINSFAGSDVELFNKFKEEFPIKSAIKDLTINRRSNRDIVNFGNRIMEGRGIESDVDPDNREGGIIKCLNINQDQEWFDINKARAEFDTDADVVLLRYLDRAVNIVDKYFEKLKESNTFKILFLSRKSKVRQIGLDDFTKKIEIFLTKKYPEDKNKIKVFFNEQIDKNGEKYRQIESKTVHQSKGLEANVVIVIEATNRCFPLIHPDSLLFEIFGDKLDKIIDEEQRLFYVACTRAKSHLYLLYEEDFDKKKILTAFYPY